MAQTVPVRDLHRVVGTCYIYRLRGGTPEFLLIKRPLNIKPYPGKWTVPGGGMERTSYESRPKENGGWKNPVIRALLAEIEDEVGVEVGELEYVGSFADIREHDDLPVFGMQYMARYVARPVRLNPEEATEHAWVSASIVHQYNCLGSIAVDIVNLSRKLQMRA